MEGHPSNLKLQKAVIAWGVVSVCWSVLTQGNWLFWMFVSSGIYFLIHLSVDSQQTNKDQASKDSANLITGEQLTPSSPLQRTVPPRYLKLITCVVLLTLSYGFSVSYSAYISLSLLLGLAFGWAALFFLIYQKFGRHVTKLNFIVTYCLTLPVVLLLLNVVYMQTPAYHQYERERAQIAQEEDKQQAKLNEESRKQNEIAVAEAERKRSEYEASPEFAKLRICGAIQEKGDSLLGNITFIQPSALQRCDVVKRIDGKYSVVINYTNTLDGVQWIEQMMAGTIYRAYRAGFPLHTVKIVAYSSLIDEYGNKHNGPVYKAELEGTAGNKINWDAGEFVLIKDIIPLHWKTKDFLHD